MREPRIVRRVTDTDSHAFYFMVPDSGDVYRAELPIASGGNKYRISGKNCIRIDCSDLSFAEQVIVVNAYVSFR